jgi:hypothetical protein
MPEIEEASALLGAAAAVWRTVSVQFSESRALDSRGTGKTRVFSTLHCWR